MITQYISHSVCLPRQVECLQYNNWLHVTLCFINLVRHSITCGTAHVTVYVILMQTTLHSHILSLYDSLAVIVCPSICLSVCLSVTSQSCTKMVKLRITLTTPHDSPGTLVFKKSPQNSNDITHMGAQNRGGVGSHQYFFTNISLYLRNSARWGYTCYGRLIGTHMRSIERRYFH